jgi:hypothetical protein
MNLALQNAKEQSTIPAEPGTGVIHSDLTAMETQPRTSCAHQI